MSIGLTHVFVYFMYLMNKVFMEYMEKVVVMFIDNILVFSKTEDDHEEQLRLVIQNLWEHQLYAKVSCSGSEKGDGCAELESDSRC